jgi:endonuclease III
MPFRKLEEKEAKKAIATLISKYPDAHYYLNFKTDIDLLVAAIISAQTRDEVTNSVTPQLFEKYKTVKDYANANEKELFELIRRVTFGGNKARNIIAACKIIIGQYGGKIPRTMEGLTSLPGVGRKTANTVLINAYGIAEGIPVDTWVIKLSGRIGLSQSDDPEEIEQDLMKLVDKKDWKKITYVFKNHGKAICQSRVPICSKCILAKVCPRNGVTNSL